ncbi:hypothetical protein ACMU_08240 [Actibacterium mucosum KCTC 23349]|uniref:Uncharacterized protein n=1 Tax=Actibacterium mucosum KCTC 23349 TaxID=1454373 RepID=A0A037ZJF4_9RHOB|nr:hypothetical protein ACMU_08240 [Actibacterium mucosum KCTC 23349]
MSALQNPLRFLDNRGIDNAPIQEHGSAFAFAICSTNQFCPNDIGFGWMKCIINYSNLLGMDGEFSRKPKLRGIFCVRPDDILVVDGDSDAIKRWRQIKCP